MKSKSNLTPTHEHEETCWSPNGSDMSDTVFFACVQGEDGQKGTIGYPGRKGNQGRGVSHKISPHFFLFYFYCAASVTFFFYFWSDQSRGTQAGREIQAHLETRELKDTG